MRARAPALAVVGFLACGGPRVDAATSFGVGSGPAGESDSGGPSPASTSSGSTGTSEHIPEDSTSTTAGTSSTTGLLHDVGGPDFGDPKPAGCKGKIDFLFVISRIGNMELMQERLIAAFPKFIATIAEKFEDFDYHIMVVDGDAGWGWPPCTASCPTLTCKFGDPCCPIPPPCHENGCNKIGDPCCALPDYPCDLVPHATACDETMGAGSILNVGKYAPNARCEIAGGRRYLTREQPNLAETFACIAQIGVSGGDQLASAVVAAVSPELNGPGGCNEGFLREDALLMVTFIYNTPDIFSPGKPKLWADALYEAKHGDPSAFMMFALTGPCTPWDRVCAMMQHYFPHWYIGDDQEEDYGPAFEVAADKVLEACSEFIPR